MAQTKSRDSTISCPKSLMRTTEGKREWRRWVLASGKLVRDQDITDVRVHGRLMCVPPSFLLGKPHRAPGLSQSLSHGIMLTACVLAYQVGPHDLLIMMRPTGLNANAYQPLQTPLLGDAGEKWDPKIYKRRRDAPTGVLHHTPICSSCKSAETDHR